MPLQGSNALSLMLKKGHDRRREDELWKAFSEADKNNDGYLSVEEYVSVFRSHGIQISQEEVLLFFNSKDRDRDGRISYEEFCDRETVNERAFKAMDLNNDGFITKTEMLKASNRGSRRLSAADVEACFREFDRDGDKKLSYDEFCAMMNTRRHSLELLLEHHTDGKEKQNGQKKSPPLLSPCKSPSKSSTATASSLADSGRGDSASTSTSTSSSSNSSSNSSGNSSGNSSSDNNGGRRSRRGSTAI